MKVRATLEKHFKDVQDVEFTIQEGKLFMLQTRNGKRTAAAALKFSMDMVQGEAHRLENRRSPQSRRSARPIPRPDLRPCGSEESQSHRHRPPRRPRRGYRQDLPQRRPRRHAAEARRKSPARPQRNLAGRFARHDRGRRHPHRERRRQLRTRRSWRGRWAKSASAARARCRLITRKKTVTRDRARPLRKATSFPLTAPPARFMAAQLNTAPSEIIAGLIHGDKAAQKHRKIQELPPAHEMVLAGHAPAMSARTPTPPSRPQNALAFGAIGIGLTRTEHMFFEGNRIDAMREMILADNLDGPEEARSRNCCRINAKISPASSKRSKATRPPSVSSIRRCTSSCRTTKNRKRDLAKKLGITPEKIKQRVARTPRVQPDARPSRLPPRHRVSRDHRDAGARRVRGRRGCDQSKDQSEARDHDPARRLQKGTRPPGRDRPPRRESSHGREESEDSTTSSAR